MSLPVSSCLLDAGQNFESGKRLMIYSTSCLTRQGHRLLLQHLLKALPLRCMEHFGWTLSHNLKQVLQYFTFRSIVGKSVDSMLSRFPYCSAQLACEKMAARSLACKGWTSIP